MKLKIIALIVCSAALSLAQTSTPPKTNPGQSPATAVPGESKTESSSCAKMADSKHAGSCCAQHEEGAAKPEMPCCHAKDGKMAMSCMNADKNESAGMCSSESKSRSGEKESGPGDSNKNAEHHAMNCCEAMASHCAMAHEDHAEMKK